MWCIAVVALQLLSQSVVRPDHYSVIRYADGILHDNIIEARWPDIMNKVTELQNKRIVLSEGLIGGTGVRVCSEQLRPHIMERILVRSAARSERIDHATVSRNPVGVSETCAIQLAGGKLFGKSVDRVSDLGQIGVSCLPHEVLLEVQRRQLQVRGDFACYQSREEDVQSSTRVVMADQPLDLTYLNSGMGEKVMFKYEGRVVWLRYLGRRLYVLTQSKNKRYSHIINQYGKIKGRSTIIPDNLVNLHTTPRLMVAMSRGKLERIGGEDRTNGPKGNLPATAIIAALQAVTAALVSKRKILFKAGNEKRASMVSDIVKKAVEAIEDKDDGCDWSLVVKAFSKTSGSSPVSSPVTRAMKDATIENLINKSRSKFRSYPEKPLIFKEDDTLSQNFTLLDVAEGSSSKQPSPESKEKPTQHGSNPEGVEQGLQANENKGIIVPRAEEKPVQTDEVVSENVTHSKKEKKLYQEIRREKNSNVANSAIKGKAELRSRYQDTAWQSYGSADKLKRIYSAVSLNDSDNVMWGDQQYNWDSQQVMDEYKAEFRKPEPTRLDTISEGRTGGSRDGEVLSVSINGYRADSLRAYLGLKAGDPTLENMMVTTRQEMHYVRAMEHGVEKSALKENTRQRVYQKLAPLQLDALISACAWESLTKLTNRLCQKIGKALVIVSNNDSVTCLKAYSSAKELYDDLVPVIVRSRHIITDAQLSRLVEKVWASSERTTMQRTHVLVPKKEVRTSLTVLRDLRTYPAQTKFVETVIRKYIVDKLVIKIRGMPKDFKPAGAKGSRCNSRSDKHIQKLCNKLAIETIRRGARLDKEYTTIGGDIQQFLDGDESVMLGYLRPYISAEVKNSEQLWNSVVTLHKSGAEKTKKKLLVRPSHFSSRYEATNDYGSAMIEGLSGQYEEYDQSYFEEYEDEWCD